MIFFCVVVRSNALQIPYGESRLEVIEISSNASQKEQIKRAFWTKTQEN